MLSPNSLYRQQSLELERERIRYIQCNIIVETFLIVTIIAITTGIVIYVILFVSNTN